MNKNLFFKKHLPNIMLLLMGFIVFLALCFPVLQVSFYDGYLKTVSENGFKMLAFSSDFISKYFAATNIPLGLVAWFTLLVAIGSIVVSVLGFTNTNGKISKKLSFISIIVCICQLFLYMLSGFIFKIVYSSAGAWYKYDSISSSHINYIKTLAFIPFIFGVIVLGIYFLLPLLTKDNAVSDNSEIIMKNDVQTKLSELKQLWDLGVITEDEYREKSKKYIDYL